MDTVPVEVWGEGEPVLLIHGSGAPAPIGEMWARQYPLAERYKLMILTRRGYGERPVAMQTDVEGDVGDVLGVLGEGAHIVGFSYGGIVSLVAAARKPELVRSLTVIEPPALGVVHGNAAADAQVDGLSRFEPPPLGKTPEAFWADFRRLMGQAVPEQVVLSPIERKAVEAHMAEAPPWTVHIPLDTLASTSFPKLVVSGDWNPAMDAVADIITGRLHAERFVLKGWYHNIHRAGEPFNQRLDAFLQEAMRLRSA
jgi:pimeloyl-ACP methyl ester carboxylesterase